MELEQLYQHLGSYISNGYDQKTQTSLNKETNMELRCQVEMNWYEVGKEIPREGILLFKRTIGNHEKLTVSKFD